MIEMSKIMNVDGERFLSFYNSTMWGHTTKMNVGSFGADEKKNFSHKEHRSTMELTPASGSHQGGGLYIWIRQ